MLVIRRSFYEEVRMGLTGVFVEVQFVYAGI